jgi:tRNA-specific 2-thiouridylase
VLGRHAGIIHFTVGQRKGLGLAGNEEPLFVVLLDAASRRVVVGRRDSLSTQKIRLGFVNWLMSPGAGPLICAVKVRSTRPPAAARIVPLADAMAEVELISGEDAVAPGQACVFYEQGGTRVLGGGWIVKTEPAQAAA